MRPVRNIDLLPFSGVRTSPPPSKSKMQSSLKSTCLRKYSRFPPIFHKHVISSLPPSPFSCCKHNLITRFASWIILSVRPCFELSGSALTQQPLLNRLPAVVRCWLYNLISINERSLYVSFYFLATSCRIIVNKCLSSSDLVSFVTNVVINGRALIFVIEVLIVNDHRVDANFLK